MAAKKLSTDFPPIILRSFDNFEDVFQRLKGLVRTIVELKRQIISAVNDHGTRLIPLTGTVAPTSTPTDTQLFYLDTVAKDMYVSVGTASSADWKKVTP